MTGVWLCELLQRDETLSSTGNLQERPSQGELVGGRVFAKEDDRAPVRVGGRGRLYETVQDLSILRFGVIGAWS